MKSFAVLGFLFLYSTQVLGGSSQSESDLMAYLFEGQSYTKNIRPSEDYSNDMNIYLDLELLGIIEVNEREQKLVTVGTLYVSWIDELLTWDKDDYEDIHTFLISQSEIWKPDLALWNGFKKTSELGNDFILVSIQNDGRVSWAPSEVFETQCSIGVKYFPFDEQLCDIVIAPWVMNSEWFTFESHNKAIYLHNYEQDNMWTIIGTSASVKKLNDYDEYGMVFTVKLKRNSSYYMYNLILPIILLSILSVFTFALPTESGERVGYGLTVFLALAVFMTIVSSDLPKTSGSLLGGYMAFELTVSTLMVFFTTLQLRVHQRKDSVPQTIVRLFNLKYFPCKRVFKVECGNENNSLNTGRINEMTWVDVISKIDFMFFWTMVILKIVGITIYMKLLKSQ